MAIPYEILIRGNDGQLSGCHVIDEPGGMPRAITTADLAAIAPEINAAAIAQTETLVADHAAALADKEAELFTAQNALAELIEYKDAMVSRVSAVLQSGDPAQYEALAQEFLTPAQELERQAILAQIAELQAKLEP